MNVLEKRLLELTATITQQIVTTRSGTAEQDSARFNPGKVNNKINPAYPILKKHNIGGLSDQSEFTDWYMIAGMYDL